MIDWKKEYYSGKNTAMVQVTVMDTETIKAMQNLAKRALRAGCKVLRQKMKASPEYSEHLKNHIHSSVKIDRSTGQAVGRIGFSSAKRVKDRGKIPSRRNPAWHEGGTKGHEIKAPGRKSNATALVIPKKGDYQSIYFGQAVQHPGLPAQNTLRRICEANIDEIRKTEEKYLAQLAEEVEKALEVDYDEEVDDGAD